VVASNNADAGIWLGGIAIVTRCIVRNNAGGNDGNGIETGFGATVTNCVAESNAGEGIACISGAIHACAARFNGFSGISGSDGVVSNCSADQNTGNGIGTTSGTIRSCVSRQNGGDGFWASDSSTIIDCTALLNTGNGIHVRNSCRIADNLCRANGLNAADAAGIFIEQDHCRVQGNNLVQNDRGIDIDGTGNFVVANTASGNTTNYDIAAGNTLGPIANFAGAGITTSNPWTNFEY
jgi:parallel beta-helix repeat protein